jgi:uncharacterized repeat protein (TIGR02543 family)
MNQIKIIFILFLLNAPYISQAQRLWDIEISRDDFWAVQQDTSVEHLRGYIINKHMKMDAAARILAVNCGEAEKDFILSNFFISSVGQPLYKSWESQYYDYQLFRGYFGYQDAIQGMDTLARMQETSIIKFMAILQLAEAGRFDYFDTLQDAIRNRLPDILVVPILALYGKNSQYKITAGNLLADTISLSTDVGNVGSFARSLAEFDKPRAINLLEARFRSTQGDIKLSIFGDLCDIDPDNSPELSKEGITSETDEYLKALYFPSYSVIVKYGKPTVKYLTPSFVKFALDWLSTEQSIIVKYTARSFFLNPFIPLSPSPSTPVLTLVDSLIEIKDTVGTYGWVSDGSFIALLDSDLTVARSYIIACDSNNCARQIKLFQQKVDEEYRDSLDGDNKTVTIEGWKFLYYNAQYILERLQIPPPQYNLNINVIGNGTVTKSPEFAMYDSATTVTLTATPGTGYKFSAWSGDVSDTANPVNVVMSGNNTITATFIQNVFVITATAGANGSIVPSGEVSVTYGENQSFTISPSTGYHVDSVIVDGIKVDSTTSYTFTNVTTAHIISVSFAINTYTIMPTAGVNGAISPSSPATVNYGGSQTFTITPNSCYHVDSVLVDGVNQGTITSYTFTNVIANHTIRSVYAINQNTITASASVNGTISPSGIVNLNCGLNQSFTITPNTGYHVDSVIVDGVNQGALASYAFNNVTVNHTITAKFAINIYTLTVNATNGTVTKNPNQSTYNYGTSVQLTATPITGYHFVNWTGDTTSSVNPVTITMNANKTVMANFAINTYTLTVNATNGTVTKNPNQSTYNYGTSVQLTATPATGYYFVNWTGDLTGTTNPANITMNANKTVTANFALTAPTISSFTPSSGPVGTSVTITGANFVGITSVKFNGTTASYTVNSPTQITATVPTGTTTGTISVTNSAGTGTSTSAFTITVSYTLTIQISGSGRVLKSPNQTNYTPGTSVTLTGIGSEFAAQQGVTPNIPAPISWEFDHWEIDLTGTQNPKTIIMNGNKTVKAVFVEGN